MPPDPQPSRAEGLGCKCLRSLGTQLASGLLDHPPERHHHPSCRALASRSVQITGKFPRADGDSLAPEGLPHIDWTEVKLVCFLPPVSLASSRFVFATGCPSESPQFRLCVKVSGFSADLLGEVEILLIYFSLPTSPLPFYLALGYSGTKENSDFPHLNHSFNLCRGHNPCFGGMLCDTA